jgi:hypothetical protein
MFVHIHKCFLDFECDLKGKGNCFVDLKCNIEEKFIFELRNWWGPKALENGCKKERKFIIIVKAGHPRLGHPRTS